MITEARVEPQRDGPVAENLARSRLEGIRLQTGCASGSLPAKQNYCGSDVEMVLRPPRRPRTRQSFGETRDSTGEQLFFIGYTPSWAYLL